MGLEQKIDTAIGASALDWWREAGVDALIDEVPRNWLATEPAPVPLRHAPAARHAARPAAPVAPALSFPDTLAAFEAWRLSDDAPEAAWPGARIGAQGSAASGLMILIEMPEREDSPDKLLSGAPGALFDRMLAAIGRDRASIYLVPMAVVRPISGRIPAETEASLATLIRAHIRLAAPKALLIIGNAASRALIGTDVARARGHLHAINHEGGEGSATAVASFHPRFLLERPAAKAEAWKDLQLLIRGLS
ncbi:MAG: uracil-DNA glycosylase [Sphingomonas sp.]|uniref:uracil-DNA glycosylase family protein n=1 Tax=Sphingomonas sp. TaxID=28214 RepID=UPI0025F1130F|nr:uracil-DNA glycosylase family protein [Sphingomonas sp.]MBY0284275.1 uracil-DNA glycosylase [Sphingomonas sp.]